MPSTRVPLALAALLVLAGCSGLSGSGGTPGPATGSSTAGTTPIESPRTTVPPAVIVDFEDLSSREQRPALAAIENGSATANVTVWENLAPAEDRDLRYGGERYALTWHHERNEAKYALDGVEQVNASTVEDDAAVVPYANLTDRGRELFDAARSGGSTEFNYADAFPDALVENRYVRYDGTYYRLPVTVADIPIWRVTAEPVE